MRVRFFLVTVSLSAVLAGAAIAACGGDTEGTVLDADAGNEAASSADAVADAPLEASKPDTGAGNCDTSGDFTDEIPDASLAGVSSTGVCSQCLKKNCSTTIETCNKDCNCRAFVGDVLKCVQKGGKTIEQCALGSSVTPTTKTFGIAQGLQPCLQKCNDECAVDELADAGRDAN
jgi:hypothetical protein